MKSIDELAVKATRRGAKMLEERRTLQALEIRHDDDFEVYALNPTGQRESNLKWPERWKRADGFVVASVNGRSWVIFMELKGKPRKEKPGKPPVTAFDQLKDAIRYFHSTTPAPGEGSRLHEEWARGKHLPAVIPDRSHSVVGIAVMVRVGAGLPDEDLVLGKKVVPLRVVQLSQRAPDSAVSVKELLRKAGLHA